MIHNLERVFDQSLSLFTVQVVSYGLSFLKLIDFNWLCIDNYLLEEKTVDQLG